MIIIFLIFRDKAKVSFVVITVLAIIRISVIIKARVI